MTEFGKVKLETVKFMRGKYRLDEVAGKYYDIDCLKFRQGKKTILSINIHEKHYDFQLILGKKEREKFDAQRNEFSKEIQELYDRERTLHDGKWLLIRVDNLKTLEEVKKLVLIKKNPNRKPFPKENAVYGKCGHRCDLCVHYTGLAEDFREMLIPHLTAVYGNPDWNMRCTGCNTSGCHCYCDGNELCEPLKCLQTKEYKTCIECAVYPCQNATVGYRQLEPRSISADDITWAVLPYVPFQYE
mgnify:CR=1 FL=1